jgi:hypothetical protein
MSEFLNPRESFFAALTEKELIEKAELAAVGIAESEQEDEALKYAIKMRKYVDHLEKLVRTSLQGRLTDSFYSPHIEVKEQYRDTLAFEQDSVFRELSDKLKERKELLTQAHKSGAGGNVIVDSDGCQVPIVAVKKGAKFLTIKIK